MNAIDELKTISGKKHVVTSIEYDCPSEEKEDEVFETVRGILKHHLDEVAKITYDFAPIMEREIQIKTVFRYRNLYPTAIAAIANGKIDVSGIVSHEYEFERIQEAFMQSIKRKQEIVKAIIRM